MNHEDRAANQELTAPTLVHMGRFADEVLARISRAQLRVDVECFIVRDDRLGRALADALSDAASRGVPCRLLYDPLGAGRRPDVSFGRSLAGVYPSEGSVGSAP